MLNTKWFFPLLILFSVPGFSQNNPDSISFFYPDTILSLENSLVFVEKTTDIYFSYNPKNLQLEEIIDISSGWWTLRDFAGFITSEET